MSIAKNALTAGILTAVLFLGGCDLFNPFKGEILTGDRTLRVDVQDSIFSLYGFPAEEAWTWGLGASSVEITVVTDADSYTGTLAGGSLDPVYAYTALDIPVTGRLKSVTAVVKTTEKEFAAVLDQVSDSSYWTGWETFANLTKFRVSAEVDPEAAVNSTARVDVCPRGGFSLTLRTDVGVTTSEEAHTDRGTDLVSGQIALEPQFLENPQGLSYTVYYGIFSEDVKALTDPTITLEASYLVYPWAEVWTVAEMTETGRTIGSAVYTLPDYVAAEDAADPLGDGKHAFLLDFTGSGLADLLGQYLVAGIVVNYGGLKVPGRMICVEIE